MNLEFEEISHSGGKVTFIVKRMNDGRIGYQVQYALESQGPLKIIEVYALNPGIVIEPVSYEKHDMGMKPPKVSGCFPVLIASDSEGMFGHQCPSCKQYWRSGPFPNICPYCGITKDSVDFFSEAQNKYVQVYCSVLSSSLKNIKNGQVIIDIDEIANKANNEGNTPAFYFSEQRQQKVYKCVSCGESNDIIGRFCYCSLCGTRNDIVEFKNILDAIRERNSSESTEESLRNAISGFDSFVSQIVKQLVLHIPLSKKRKKYIENKRFHNIEDVDKIFKSWYDIEILKNIKNIDFEFIKKMFLRRHVYEHNAGIIDQKYLDDSQDCSVRINQHISEKYSDIYRMLGILIRIAENINEGFIDIFPPINEPIEQFKKRKIA